MRLLRNLTLGTAVAAAGLLAPNSHAMEEFFFGLSHTTVGGARLVPNADTGMVELTNIDPSGGSGVRLDLPGVKDVVWDINTPPAAAWAGPAGNDIILRKKPGQVTYKEDAEDIVRVLRMEAMDDGNAAVYLLEGFTDPVTIEALRAGDDGRWFVTLGSTFDDFAGAPHAVVTGAFGETENGPLRLEWDAGHGSSSKNLGGGGGAGGSILITGVGAGGVRLHDMEEHIPADAIRISWDAEEDGVLTELGIFPYGDAMAASSIGLRAGVGLFGQRVFATGGARMSNPLYEAETEVENPLFEDALAAHGGGGGGGGRIFVHARFPGPGTFAGFTEAAESFSLPGPGTFAGYAMRVESTGGTLALFDGLRVQGDVTGEIWLDEGREMRFEPDGAGAMTLTTRAPEGGGGAGGGIVRVETRLGNLLAGDIEVINDPPVASAPLVSGLPAGEAFTMAHHDGHVVCWGGNCSANPDSKSASADAYCDADGMRAISIELDSPRVLQLPGGAPHSADRVRIVYSSGNCGEHAYDSSLVIDLAPNAEMFITGLNPVDGLTTPADEEDLDLGVGPIQGGLVAVGTDVCFEIPSGGAVNIQWDKDGVVLTGRTSRRLCIPNVRVADSGRYRAVFEDGSKNVQEYVVFLTVSEDLPAAGLGGLALLALAGAFGGAAALRRRK